MRLALLADVHANLPALRAVLARVRHEVDGYVFAGDAVGYGPHPDACVAALAELPLTAVAGNHDLIAIGRLGRDRCSQTARETLRWTTSVLGADARAWLGGLPGVAERGPLTVAHGSPGDPQEYVETPRRAAELLSGLPGGAEQILVLGHTHRPWACAAAGGTALVRRTGEVRLGASGPWLINPGSVGQSRERDPRARYAVLDLERGTLRLEAVAYDLGETVAALRAAGLPPTASYSPPSRLAPARRVVSRMRAQWPRR